MAISSSRAQESKLEASEFMEPVIQSKELDASMLIDCQLKFTPDYVRMCENHLCPDLPCYFLGTCPAYQAYKAHK